MSTNSGEVQDAKGREFVEIIISYYDTLEEYTEQDITSDTLEYVALIKSESKHFFNLFAKSGRNIILRRNPTDENLASYINNNKDIVISFNNEPDFETFEHELVHLLQMIETLARQKIGEEKIPVGSAVYFNTRDYFRYATNSDELEKSLSIYISNLKEKGINEVSYYDKMVLDIFRDILVKAKIKGSKALLFAKLSDDRSLKKRIIKRLNREGITYIESKNYSVP